MKRLYKVAGKRMLSTHEGWLLASVLSITEFFKGSKTVAEFVNSVSEKCHPPKVDDYDPPVLRQEIWGAGLTYFRSKAALTQESQYRSPYDKVYDAHRPQLFFKALAEKTVGNKSFIGIRNDSSRTVPEPELGLVANARGVLIGYCLGNDVTARDIEAENPLYQPQAKIYIGSCALGPCILLPDGNHKPSDWNILMRVVRSERTLFMGQVSVGSMKRSYTELLNFLFRHQEFPVGGVLLSGTGIVPEDDFHLVDGDIVEIECQPIGALTNVVRRLDS